LYAANVYSLRLHANHEYEKRGLKDHTDYRSASNSDLYCYRDYFRCTWPFRWACSYLSVQLCN